MSVDVNKTDEGTVHNVYTLYIRHSPPDLVYLCQCLPP